MSLNFYANFSPENRSSINNYGGLIIIVKTWLVNGGICIKQRQLQLVKRTVKVNIMFVTCILLERDSVN